MYEVHFDSDDSFIFCGESLYFKNKENIMPFIKKELEKELSAIKEVFEYNTVEEYLDSFKPYFYYPWYITEIKTVD